MSYDGGMSKFEHMSDAEAITHASMVGHLARGTILEGKSHTRSLSEAHDAVGPDSGALARIDATHGIDKYGQHARTDMQRRWVESFNRKINRPQQGE